MHFIDTPSFLKTPIRIAIVLSLLAASFLSFESYLLLQGSSLCKTTACEIAGRYLQIKEEILIAFGSAFFWILSLALYFALRYPNRFKSLPFILLAPALAFDGVIFGFQVFSINKICIICICTAVTLLIILFLYGLACRSIVLLSCILLAWTCSFFANSIIEYRVAESQNSMILLGKNSLSNVQDTPTVTLIFSLNCTHCMDLVSFIEQSPHSSLNWRFASIDQDKQSIEKIITFMQRAPSTENLFSLLNEIKKAESMQDISRSVASGILQKNKATAFYLSNLNIDRIPVLIVQYPENKLVILTGNDLSKSFLEDLFKSYAIPSNQ